MSVIGIYGGTSGERGTPARLSIAYNSLTLNNAADDSTDTYEVNTVVGQTAMDYISENNQQRDGMEVYPFRKTSRIESIRGVIRAPTREKLHDKIVALAKTFDPALIGHNYSSDPFQLKLTFSVPTTDTTTFPSGVVDSFYYAQPYKLPDPIIDYATGTTAQFEVVMMMRDPRRYYQTVDGLVGAGTISNTIGNYHSPCTFTLTMSADTGSATFSVTNTTSTHGAQALTLDLSGLSSGDVVSVDMERRKITVNDTETPSLFVSGSYFHIDPGNNVITYANTTNTTGSTISYYPAFSL